MTPLMPLLRPLQFVSGKGGVGKSAISAAIALALAQAGRKVLLFQVNAEDAHSAMLGTAAIDPVLREILPNLFAVNTTPQDALREYAMISLRYKAVYAAVFENRVVKNFLRFIPSLAELNMLGKAWYHLDLGRNHPQVFDHVIVDAPATGHGLSFIRVARVIADGAVAGPLKNKALEMAKTIENPELSALHLVSLAEQMPATETIELANQVKRLGVVPFGLAFLNRLGPVRLSEAGRDLLQRQQGLRTNYPDQWTCADQAAMREIQQQSIREALRTAIDLPWVDIADQFVTLHQREQIQKIADALTEQTGLKAALSALPHRSRL